MKKAIISIISAWLVLCLVSCAGISDEKKQQISDTMKAYEDAVLGVGKQLEELAEYNGKLEDYPTVFAYYDEKYMELVTLKQALKDEYDKNIDSFTDETAAEFIEQFHEPMEKAQKYFEDISSYIKYLEDK